MAVVGILSVAAAAISKLPLPASLPPVQDMALLTAIAPVPLISPFVKFKLVILAAPLSDKVPPDTFKVPVPSTAVAPPTAKEPPETSSELALLMVNAAMLSVPVLCVTAWPTLSSTLSPLLGKVLVLQLPGVCHVKPPA